MSGTWRPPARFERGRGHGRRARGKVCREAHLFYCLEPEGHDRNHEGDRQPGDASVRAVAGPQAGRSRAATRRDPPREGGSLARDHHARGRARGAESRAGAGTAGPTAARGRARHAAGASGEVRAAVERRQDQRRIQRALDRDQGTRRAIGELEDEILEEMEQRETVEGRIGRSTRSSNRSAPPRPTGFGSSSRRAARWSARWPRSRVAEWEW